MPDFVRKRVLADDRLVELHRKAGDGGDAARDVHDLSGVDIGRPRHDVAAHLQRHHDLFQRGIAGAFAEPVDRAFDLPRAARHGRQRVGRRHAEIVVAMRGKDDLVGARHRFDQPLDEVG